MSYYRDVYLHSREWKTLRIQALLKAKFRCALCGTRKTQRDVHHQKYKRLFDVTKNDLKVLCRSCHDKVHVLLNQYPKLKKLPKDKQWLIIRQHLSRNLSIERSPSSIKQSKTNIFGLMREVLVTIGMVKRSKMVMDQRIISPNFFPVRKRPMLYLKQYIAVTGIDPRYRADRIGPQKRLMWNSGQ